MSDSTKRFSDRVSAYVKYRPSYPAEAIDTIERLACPNQPSVIADIGSGTGIISELLLDRGHKVYCVEPNQAMREAAELQLSASPNFHSIDGQSESTTLADNSVNLIVAAQAFHWFDLNPTKIEFERILTSKGKLALIWNKRLTDGTPFLSEYENLLTTEATDYNEINHANISDDDITDFFAPNEVEILQFPNIQSFDYEGLAGRCQSSSYVPAKGHPAHDCFYSNLRSIFDRNAKNGRIYFEYTTVLYIGEFG